jgi:hypothetical protein
MRLTYTTEARIELVEATSYYKSCRKELGREFFQRIQSAEEDIIHHPEAWRSLGVPYRHKLLQKFSYGLVYHQPEADWVEVVTVMHLHREPDYWRQRTTEK